MPAGSIYVPTAQAAAARIALALEPDAPGSFVALDVVHVPVDSATVPIVRITKAAALALAPLTDVDEAACAK